MYCAIYAFHSVTHFAWRKRCEAWIKSFYVSWPQTQWQQRTITAKTTHAQSIRCKKHCGNGTCGLNGGVFCVLFVFVSVRQTNSQAHTTPIDVCNPIQSFSCLVLVEMFRPKSVACNEEFRRAWMYIERKDTETHTKRKLNFLQWKPWRKCLKRKEKL